jgi:cytochrome oxidase Cu insertion factor (SCO1/SenC/PrrC family)
MAAGIDEAEAWRQDAAIAGMVGPVSCRGRAVTAPTVPLALLVGMGVGRATLRKAAAAVALVGMLTLGLSSCGSDPQAPSASFGTVFAKPHQAPTTTLVNQDDHKMSLASFRGKYVVLAPFLTLCQEECPLTTGVFQVLQASVKRAGLAGKVAFVEVTVDPDRDSPARLQAYERRFGVDWTLLTGTGADIKAFWQPFGVWYQKVPEGKPVETDWWTGKPLTYDVDHDDGFILINPSGGERFITLDIPDLHGRLAPQLRHLLDGQGIQYLDHGASGQDYSIPQALNALSWLVGRRIPLPPN